MLQPKAPSKLDIPTFQDLVNYYGPYLGLVIGLLIVTLILQYYWYSRVLKANNNEIKRLVEHEKELNRRLMHIIDEKIGYKPSRSGKA